MAWDVMEVLCRGEAYGLIERRKKAGAPRWHLAFAFTEAGRHELGTQPEGSGGQGTLIFDADLVNAPGVSARLAVDAEQHLTALHAAIQEAFGWFDDHLYSFWLDGAFWGDKSSEYTSPITPDHGVATADVPLAELAFAPGARIAYVFDFGDEWRVMLTLRAQEKSGDATFPRVLQRKGTAPPQYGD
ncbi:MAG: IS1096 element passenger TnpR family protein [Solirubrobacterales bacterium]